MYFFFADDSKVSNPSRLGMNAVVAIGGFYVDADNLHALENGIRTICTTYGFPSNSLEGEFKWSPRRNQWMFANLTAERRSAFQIEVLQKALEHDVTARVVIESCNHAIGAQDARTHEESVATLFFERVQRSLESLNDNGVIIIDRPPGDRRDEDRFLANCIERLQTGTKFLQLRNISLNILSCPSKFIRLLQLADLITGATLSYIAGEQTYSPTIFPHIKSLLLSHDGLIGGYGLKIHPDFRYGNLYHWLLGDSHIRDFDRGTRTMTRRELPLNTRPYANSPTEP